MKRFLMFFFTLYTLCLSAHSQAVEMYNSIATAYVTTTISQIVVADSVMKQGGTFNFSVLAHNGGGRAGQSDTANVRIQFYNSGMGLMGTFQSSYSANLPNPNAVCGNPCIDPAVPWTKLSVSTTVDAASAANIAFVKISMYGIDGSYWAGDYGPWYRAPTFTLNGGTNLAYNPEFGPYNNITAQGWTSNPGFGACQGAWGGSNACIVNSSGTPGTSTTGLVANQNGGGPDANGGTTSGTAGGYSSTMTTDAPTGSATTTTTAPAPTLCCGGSAAPFNASATNVAKVQAFTNRTTADSEVYIQQLGTQNKVVVDQSGTKNNYVNYYGDGLSNDVSITQTGNGTTQVNYTDLRVVGNFNVVKLEQTSTGGGKGAFVTVQDNNNSVTLKQQDAGSHYAEVNVSGGSKTVDILQQGSAGHMANVTLSGPQPASLSLIQAGTTQQFYSIISNCTTTGGCAPISVTQGR